MLIYIDIHYMFGGLNFLQLLTQFCASQRFSLFSFTPKSQSLEDAFALPTAAMVHPSFLEGPS